VTPLDAIRSELERIKGWEQTFHAKEDGRGFCDVCCCRWPCTEAEVAQDAARVAKALETLLQKLDMIEQATEMQGDYCPNCDEVNTENPTCCTHRHVQSLVRVAYAEGALTLKGE
jgi:hypothetical protein